MKTHSRLIQSLLAASALLSSSAYARATYEFNLATQPFNRLNRTPTGVWISEDIALQGRPATLQSPAIFGPVDSCTFTQIFVPFKDGNEAYNRDTYATLLLAVATQKTLYITGSCSNYTLTTDDVTLKFK